jgi:ubiquinone/menaquinone biosynthesis C-methylase UbiE
MLKELEDFTWFPSLLRQYQLSYIGCVVKWLNIYKPIVPILKQMQTLPSINNIVDLCSGSGEPAIFLQQQTGNSYSTLLTDKFPSQIISLPPIAYHPASINALKINPKNDTLYSMYNAFHHFSTKEQTQLIENIVQNNSSIIIVEILTPSIYSFASVLFAGTLLQCIITPFIKPFSIKRLFFTYILPINIFTVVYDGIISVLRSKSSRQYKTFVNKIHTINYNMEVQPIKTWKGTLICIKIYPKCKCN